MYKNGLYSLSLDHDRVSNAQEVRADLRVDDSNARITIIPSN